MITADELAKYLGEDDDCQCDEHRLARALAAARAALAAGARIMVAQHVDLSDSDAEAEWHTPEVMADRRLWLDAMHPKEEDDE